MEIGWVIHVERESGENEWSTVAKIHLVDDTMPGREDYWYQPAGEQQRIGSHHSGRWCRISSFRRISLFDSTGHEGLGYLSYAQWPLVVGSTGEIHFSHPLHRLGSRLDYTYSVWRIDQCLDEAVVDSGWAGGFASR